MRRESSRSKPPLNCGTEKENSETGVAVRYVLPVVSLRMQLGVEPVDNNCVTRLQPYLSVALFEHVLALESKKGWKRPLMIVYCPSYYLT